jgi:hypothetical protein
MKRINSKGESDKCKGNCDFRPSAEALAVKEVISAVFLRLW